MLQGKLDLETTHQAVKARHTVGDIFKVGPDEFVRLRISDLVREKNQSRSKRDDEKMRSLVESIEEHGIMQAPGVVPTHDGRWELVFGNRRVAALEELKDNEITCKVMSHDPNLSAADKARLNFTENAEHASVGIMEAAKTFLELLNSGMTTKEIAYTCRTTEKKVTQCVNILKCIDPKYLKLVVPDDKSRKDEQDGILTESKLTDIITNQIRYNFDKKMLNSLCEAARTKGVDGKGISAVARELHLGVPVEKAVSDYLEETKTFTRWSQSWRVRRRKLAAFEAKYKRKHMNKIFAKALRDFDLDGEDGESARDFLKEVSTLISPRG